MRWRDAFGFAARSVERRLGRAALTVLAVALAAALLSSLLIAGNVARERVLDELTHGGPLTGIRVDAAAPGLGALDSDSARLGAPRAIDDAALARIKRLDGVRAVSPVVIHPVLMLPPDPPVRPDAKLPPGVSATTFSDLNSSIIGVDLRRAGDVPLSLVAGRLPAPDATTEVAVTLGYLQRLGLTKDQADAVVGTELEYGAPRVFRELGSATVRGRWSRALIVGVVAQDTGRDGEILAPLPQVLAARAWTQAGGDATSFGVGTSKYSALFVVAQRLDDVVRLRQAITDIGYSTSAPESLITQVQRYVHAVEIVLGGIGLIALVIAALGITNALLAAVRERRREIGVVKAIGGRDRDVRRMFLLEAAMLGSVGGLLGAFAGYAIARTLAAFVNRYLTEQGYAGVHVGLPMVIVFGTVAGAALLALVAGTIPAQRAARLPARRAMGDR